MPSGALGGQTTSMTTSANIKRMGRLGELYSGNTSHAAESSVGVPFTQLNGDRGWKNSIWGNGPLGAGFSAPRCEDPRGHNNAASLRSAVGSTDRKSGPSSLFASSEAENWADHRSSWADESQERRGSVQGRLQTEGSTRPCAENGSRQLSNSPFDSLEIGTHYPPRQRSAGIGRDNVFQRTDENGFDPTLPGRLRTTTAELPMETSRPGTRRSEHPLEHNHANAPMPWTGHASLRAPTERQRRPESDYFGVPGFAPGRAGSLSSSRHAPEPALYVSDADAPSQLIANQITSSKRNRQEYDAPSLSRANSRSHQHNHHIPAGILSPSVEHMNIQDNDQASMLSNRSVYLNDPYTQHGLRDAFDFGASRQALAEMSQNVLARDNINGHGATSWAADRLSNGRPTGQYQYGKQVSSYDVAQRYSSTGGGDEYLPALNGTYAPREGLPLTAFDPSEPAQSQGHPTQALALGKDSLMLPRVAGFPQLQPTFLHPSYHHIMAGQFADSYGPRQRYVAPANYQMSEFAPQFPMYAMAGFLPPLRPRSPRELEPGQSLRSALLEEFKSNAKTSKRYELKDIYDHVVEFSGDQHGSRFIQQKLETANSDEKERIFREIQSNSMQLMTDVFGNYVIQKFFEHGDQNQKKILANKMKGQVLSLSLQMYGCRVVQKALEHVLTDQQSVLVKELEGNIIKCVRDQNGNHVIQKAIERVPAEHIQFIINSFTGKVGELAIHPYGCRVIQRLLERTQGAAKASILQELHAVGPSLISDQYGNYVTQHVIEQGEPEDRNKVISLVQAQLFMFSKHKFASNVVEKGLVYCTEEQRMEIVEKLAQKNDRGETELVLLIKDQYGNYVVQKLLDLLNPVNYARFLDMLYPEIAKARRLAQGKQIQSIEKKMHRFDGLSTFHHALMPSFNTDFSNAPTPRLSLSDGQSPRSNSLPSTNTSTADGPVHSFKMPFVTDAVRDVGVIGE